MYGVACILLFGSIFAIMTFNADVSVEEVFERIYQFLSLNAEKSNGILELGYAIGVSAGIIVFYNHFGNMKFMEEPSPLELKMWQYEDTVKQYQNSNHENNQNTESVKAD